MTHKKPAFEITGSRGLPAFLDSQKTSFAFTTYQAGKLILIGLDEHRRLALAERTFNRCMGLYGDDQGFWMSSIYQLWRFKNSLKPEQRYKDHDAVFIPQTAYTTGDLDIHDIAVDNQGRTIFVNTLFSCLAVTGEDFSFQAFWKPPFISKLAPEDRCHLNGLAMKEGKPAFVTAIAESDVADGWRDHRRDGGIVVAVEGGDIVGRGLSMPHSPRWYQDKLWLLNSGAGEFGYLDLETGRFEPVAFCPGYLRGLAFCGDYALVGLSGIRDNRTFQGLPLDDALKSRNAKPRCGVMVIDLETGDTPHSLRISGVINELYDVITLPFERPMALGLKNDQIRYTLDVKEPDDTLFSTQEP